MSYYESEILKELEVGEVYTSRQVRIFLYENKDAVIISDSGQLVDSNDINYKVVSKKEKKIHKLHPTEYRTYVIPSRSSKIYEIERA